MKEFPDTVGEVLRATLILDFETFYSPEEGMDIKNLTVPGYVNHPRFRIFGAAYCKPCGAAGFVTIPGTQWDALRDTFGDNFEDVIVGMHNANFDDYVMLRGLGIRAPRILDTRQIAYHVLGSKRGSSRSSPASSVSSGGIGVPPIRPRTSYPY